MGQRGNECNVGHRDSGARIDPRIALSKLQVQLHDWRLLNFPNTTADIQLMGMMEELGELAHCNIKAREGIRGTLVEHEAREQDAIGDILIFLAGYCSFHHWDMMAIYRTTAEIVMERDWIKYPERGIRSEIH